MAEFFDALNDDHRDFIAKQPIFFRGDRRGGWPDQPVAQGI